MSSMGMATHSSILAGESPWTEQRGRLLSMRSQRVGHNKSKNHPCMQHKLAEIADLIRIMTLKLVSL